jgi:Spy/CpxP family protein refolding chaperone
MKTFTTMLVGGVFLVGLAVTAPAEPGHRQRGSHLERLQSKLNLTPEQVEQLRPTFETMQQRHQAQRQAFEAHLRTILTPEQQARMGQSHGHRGMRELDLSAEQRAQLKSYWETQRTTMGQQRSQIEAQLQATLTPEQLTQYQEMKSRWGQHRHKRQDS